MKVLYAALRHDPRDIDRSSSVDYGFYRAIAAAGHELRVVGPFPPQPSLAERGVKKAHDALTGRRYLKWDWASIRRASRTVNAAVDSWRPDLVFTIFPATLAFYNRPAPAVFNTDLTFGSWQANGANFSRPALRALHWIEGRAVHRSARVVLHSEWSRQDIVARHGASPAKLRVMPMPSAIPVDAVPPAATVLADKQLTSPLRLLLVGKEFHRKGVDIALEVVGRLNAQGVAARLTVCATEGPPAPHVKYVGRYRKSDPRQLASYVQLYRQAHLLLHPARFEPSGIVPGEAAAFGVPTVTNDTGGLATTVKHGVSGIVLPRHSPADAYVAAILGLIYDPGRYAALCRSTRRRYDAELNWRAAGQTLDAILHEAAANNGQQLMPVAGPSTAR